MQRVFLYTIFLLLHFYLLSQSKNTTLNNQQWIQYYFTGNLNKKWTFTADGGFRVKDNFSENSQFLFRTGTMAGLSGSVKIGGGFAVLGFYETNDLAQIEFRPYQELVVKQSEGIFSYSHRLRVEERIFENIASESTHSSSGFNLRFRYQLKSAISLWEFGSPHQSLSLILANEIFINAGKEIIYNVFDQNRLMIGPRFSLTKNLDLSLIYNYQYSSRNLPNRYDITHIFWLRAYHKLDF